MYHHEAQFGPGKKRKKKKKIKTSFLGSILVRKLLA